jgi:5-methylcytosine-specific restriction enzyme A
MTKTLLRPCLDCGQAIRGKPRCRDCHAKVDRAKQARRPDLHADAQERERRRRVVADHRATIGDWCPGLEDHPAHPSADLVADHVIEVAVSGLATGPLRVLCHQENGRRSGHLAAAFLTTMQANHPSPAEPPNGRLDEPGPVVA